jgi:histone arginine demethylase JMJD6
MDINGADINRIPLISPEEFWSTVGAAKRPVIVENSVPDWRPAEEWTLEYLKRAVGHRVTGLDRGYYDQSAANEIVVGEVLGAIENKASIAGHDNPYLRNIDVHRDLPELVQELSPRLGYSQPNWMACKFLKRHVPDGLVEFFVGGAGSSFPKLHIDTHGTHAFITQLQGTKHIVAAPPSATADLARAFGDPEQFRLDCEPHEYENVEIYSTTLRAGDTLYVPAGWWHTTYMTELSVSVSTNCVNAVNWPDYVDAVTKHTQGLKRPVKRVLLAALGAALRISDTIGFNGLYRKYE